MANLPPTKSGNPVTATAPAASRAVAFSPGKGGTGVAIGGRGGLMHVQTPLMPGGHSAHPLQRAGIVPGMAHTPGGGAVPRTGEAAPAADHFSGLIPVYVR